MSNTQFCFPNRAAALAYSGQGFVPTLPLRHLTTRQQAQVARTHPAPVGRWYMQSATPIAVAVAALSGHSLGNAGKWRLRSYATDPRYPVDQSAQAATLDLHFALGLLPAAGLACARASSATYIGSDGLLKTAANDTARLAFDPATLECLGLLVEAAATNLLPWCRDLTQATWTRTNCTAALTATGIDGVANTATRLTATAANGGVTRAGVGTANTFSLYLRRVSGIGAVQISADGFSTSTTVTLTNSWQRFAIAGFVSTSVGVRMVVGGDVIECDYLQAEAGPAAQPSTPILTGATAANRVADAFTYTPSVSVALAAGTMVARARWAYIGSSGQMVRAQQASAAVTAAALLHGGSGGVTAEYTAASSVQCSLATGGSAPAVAAEWTAAFSWAANAYRASRSGTSAVTDSVGTVDAVNTASVLLGAPATTGYTLARLTFLPAASSNAEVQALSTEFAPPAAAYDSGWLDAWTAEYLAGTTAEQRAGVRGLALHTPASEQTAAWWSVDVREDASTVGYIDIGRVFLGPKWQPGYNMVYGASIGYEDRNAAQESDSGAEYFSERPRARVARLTLQWQTEVEAMLQSLEMQRQLGTSGELLWLFDPADRLYAPMRSWLGRLRALQPVTCHAYRFWAMPVEIKELL